MDPETVLRLLHVIGAIVLFGTGAGIAFFMVMARRTKDAALIAHVSQTVVIADTLFTLITVLAQPVTGYLLARQTGWLLTENWLVLALILYGVMGVFWLPVVWLQIRLRDIALRAAKEGTTLPSEWFRLYRIWFACGFPAFFAVFSIIWLMVARPSLSLF